MQNIIQFISFTIFIYFCAIILHELGHYLYAIILGLNAGFSWNKGIVFETEYEKLTEENLFFMAFFGVCFGAIFIIVCTSINIAFVMLLTPYILGCVNDLQIMKKTFKGVKYDEI